MRKGAHVQTIGRIRSRNEAQADPGKASLSPGFRDDRTSTRTPDRASSTQLPCGSVLLAEPLAHRDPSPATSTRCGLPRSATSAPDHRPVTTETNSGNPKPGTPERARALEKKFHRRIRDNSREPPGTAATIGGGTVAPVDPKPARRSGPRQTPRSPRPRRSAAAPPGESTRAPAQIARDYPGRLTRSPLPISAGNRDGCSSGPRRFRAERGPATPGGRSRSAPRHPGAGSGRRPPRSRG